MVQDLVVDQSKLSNHYLGTVSNHWDLIFLYTFPLYVIDSSLLSAAGLVGIDGKFLNVDEP